MEENKELSKYGHITKDMIEEVCDNIFNSKVRKEKDFTFYVFFNNQKEADDWMEMFNNCIKEEIKNKYSE